jgi:hypothetical protein
MAFERSTKVSEIIPQRAGQGDPPNVMHRAISSISSNTVKLSIAVEEAKVQR